MAQKQGKGKNVGLEIGEGSPYASVAGRGNTGTVQHHGVEEQVSELFGKLNLTAKEKGVLLQTIMAAMRSAWGNPKGLLARMVGDNLFIAEFESEMDKKRILDGSPWRQRKEWYDVVYERLPFFRFSCGIIGHSEIECPTPATPDEKGCLPYSEKLRAPEERRFKNQSDWYSQGGSSSKRNNSSGTWGSSDSRKSSTKRIDDDDKGYGKENEMLMVMILKFIHKIEI
ncbi:hypothetical protein C2845_PM03G24450 [Panicum miliaceum]|uniref:Uncharacterized protein n=1 Tax=Panicum miliaceum TaxID=4540 RepID=A0A3L6TA95_PANMI|nr:hypothetical protein C2845_PM03G24450 [Panicum miliaceum]